MPGYHLGGRPVRPGPFGPVGPARGGVLDDKPWFFGTYAGHSTAEKSNELYRANLAKGQTGLSVAFDLPTQTGYDPDSPLARGEVRGEGGIPARDDDRCSTLLFRRQT